MPYSKQHKASTRERILASAIELFSRLGYDNVTIDGLMQHAKLTRGAFYAHFDSKSDVYLNAIGAAGQNAYVFKNLVQGLSGPDMVKAFIKGYLHQAHVEQRFSPCPLAFMVTDVANHEPKVRQAYTRVYEAFAKLLQKNIDNGDQADDESASIAYAVSAMMIGSVAIGRALDNTSLRRKLLRSSQLIAGRLLEVELNET